MTQKIKERILEKIKMAETIIIHRHIRPDPDAIGSQKGLADLIEQSFPAKKVYTAGEITAGLQALMGELNPPDPSDYEGALVIVTDTANTARLDGLDAIPSIDQVIKIDHHPNDEAYGDLIWVDTQASSCSEMIAELWCDFTDLKLSAQGAQWLYTGMVGDTNRFLYPATSPRTMRLAGELMTLDFDHAAVNHQLNTITPKIARLISYVLTNFKRVSEGMGYILLSQAVMDDLGVDDEDTSQIVSLPGNLVGVEAWAVFVEQSEGYYRARLRSKGPIINEVAKRHGGGGHPLASGTDAKDRLEVDEIIKEISEVVRANKQ